MLRPCGSNESASYFQNIFSLSPKERTELPIYDHSTKLIQAITFTDVNVEKYLFSIFFIMDFEKKKTSKHNKKYFFKKYFGPLPKKLFFKICLVVCENGIDIYCGY